MNDNTNTAVEWSEAARAAKREYNRQYRQSHKEQVLAYNRAYRQTHKEQTREYNRQYRKNNPDKYREYRRKYWERKAAEALQCQE